MRIGILPYIVILFSVLNFSFDSTAQLDLSQLVIEELEFPDTVRVGDVHILTALVTNTGNEPVFFDFDIGVNFDTVLPDLDFNFDLDELIPCNDFYLQPGETKSVSRPVYISNERVAANQQNLIITWPTGRDETVQVQGPIETEPFYVEESPSEDRIAEENDCNTVIIEQLEGVINISGLYSAEVSNISVVNQFHEVIYFCNNDCPNDEVLIDISDGGYYLVQVNLVNGFDYCYKTDQIFTENWLNYENYIRENNFPSYDGLESIFELPNLIYDSSIGFVNNLLGNLFNGTWFPNFNNTELPNELRAPNQYLGQGCGIEVILENDEFKFIKSSEGVASIQIRDIQGNIVFECDGVACAGNEIIIQLPELAEMQYTIDVSYTNNNQVCNNSISMDGGFMFDDWINPFDICSIEKLPQAPVINNVFEQSALAFIPGFFNDGALQIKKEGAIEWETIKKSYATYLLSQLDACSTYEARALYVCNDTELFSETITFTTLGCIECSSDDIDLKITNIYGGTAIINWDIFSGVNYRLHYKKQEDSVWENYETPIPFALLFNLDPCAVYEFYLEVVCAEGIVSSPGDIINLETGNCRHFINEKTEIIVYPNIAKDFINIATNNIENLSNLKVYNQAGILVHQIDDSKFINSTYQLNIADFAKGLYTVHTIANNTIYHSKFIKQ